MKKPSSLALALLAGFLPQIFDAAEAQQYSNSKGGYRIDLSRLRKSLASADDIYDVPPYVPPDFSASTGVKSSVGAD